MLFLSLLFIAAIVLIQRAGVTMNITPSMKVGLYIKQNGAVGKGDIVSFCLKDPYKKIALERNYLGTGSKCSGADPLIKEVIAAPGDNVILTDEYIKVNKNKYAFPTSHFDSLHRPLASYPRGKYLHTQGYWLIGANSQKSWDSRYFGPVSRGDILTKLKPLLVW